VRDVASTKAAIQRAAISTHHHSMSPGMLGQFLEMSQSRPFAEEFEAGHQSVPPKTGRVACFKSVCKLFQCDVEFRIDLSDDVDLMVRGVESEMKHFLCSFCFQF